MEKIDIVNENQRKNKAKNQNFCNYKSAQQPLKVTETILKEHSFNDDFILVENALNYLPKKK